MKLTKSLTINSLNRNNSIAANDSKQWLQVKHITNSKMLTLEYAEVYQKHHLKNKWILIINPDDTCLEIMDKPSASTFAKILKVKTNKVDIRLKNIHKTLQKSTCSAIILNNVVLTETEMSALYSSAEKGNTECIILNKSLRD